MAKKKTVSKAAGMATDANVDQIREIIFGSNIREYEARFQALQDEIAAAFKSLKQELKAGIKNLEGAIKNTRQSLDDETAARRNDAESLDALIQNKSAELGKDIDAVEARTGQELARLAKDAQANQLEIQRSMEGGNRDLEARLNSIAAELSERKVARDELAGLLKELAQRLEGTADDSA